MTTVKDEISKYLYNEKQIPSTSYIRYWSWGKVKDLYFKYINSRKDNE